MKRREMLAASGAAVLGLSTFRFGWTAPAEKKKQKILYFTRSAGFVHDPVNRRGQPLAFSEKILTDLGKKHDFEVECSQDGAIFDGSLDQYDLIAFYITGDLTKAPRDKKFPGSPMSVEGKKKFLDAIAAGKPFVGFHSATDAFHTPTIDPYIAMIGAEFIVHGEQQKAPMLVTSKKFPGVGELGDSIELMEEWYTMNKFADNLHVILVQETKGMKGPMYQRPPYPATWARMYQKGRVFYTSLGHREDIWTNPKVQDVMLGGIAWGLGNVAFDPKPNIAEVTPKANQVKNT
jgi:uncharacterized protein